MRGLSQIVHLAENINPVDAPEGVWVLDTGASNHMTGTRSALTQLDEGVRGTVRFGDGSQVQIHGLGSVVVEGRHQQHKVLTDVYYIPALKSNIISLGQLEEKGFKCVLENGKLSVFDQEHTLLMSAPRTGNRLYTVKLGSVSPVCLLTKTEDAAWVWHARFGHLNFRALRDLSCKGMVIGMPTVNRVEQVCDGCVLGKQHRTPFPHASKFRAEKSLQLVHADLCGHITPKTPGRCSYFLLVVDDYSRYMWVEMLKTKDQALECFKKIKLRAEVESDNKLKELRTDRGGEFNSHLFSVFCTEEGIKHYTTTPYTQQNGVVERRNQTVVEMARCMLKSMNVPAKFWGEAVLTAVYVLNRSPTKSLQGKTPFEAWHHRKPHVGHLRTFGCVANVKKIGPGINKLSDRSSKVVFIGYESGTKGYRFYDPSAGRLVISRDVIFEEHQPWDWTKSPATAQQGSETFTVHFLNSDQNPTTELAPVFPAAGEDGEDSVGQDGVVDPHEATPSPQHSPSSVQTPSHGPVTPLSQASSSSGGEPVRFRPLMDIYDSTDELHDYEYSGMCLLAADEPADVHEALEEQCWIDAMRDELLSIQENNTWYYANLPKGHKAIGLKWVFKVKRDPEGNIVKHKARLVAKGYAQRQGVDFEEVFAPVARLETVRLMLALAAQGGWEVHHMDVKSAFLNGELSEEVYVHQPPGFQNPKYPGKVLKLNKALYGLKQAPRA